MEASMNEPDKFGMIVQCRQGMDQIPTDRLRYFAKNALDLLSDKQLKSFVFVGLNGIRNHVEYGLLSTIKQNMHEIITTLKKKQQKQSKPAEQQDASATKPQSMTQLIPEQVISCNICPFLLMPEMMQLARVNRALCIIAHTPSSLSNLCIRHDPYRYDARNWEYIIDGGYVFRGGLDRFRNVERLSFCNYKNFAFEGLQFPKVQHLTLLSRQARLEIDSLPLLPSLKSVTIESCGPTVDCLTFLSQYKSTSISMASDDENQEKNQAYFNSIVYNLETIAFIGCDLRNHFTIEDPHDVKVFEQYQALSHFVLPSEPNQLKVIKFESSSFLAVSDDEYCDEWNDKFRDMRTITKSLSNLEGFVYSCFPGGSIGDDLFFELAQRILLNQTLFADLQSIHIHDPAFIMKNRNVFTLKRVNEICISLSPGLLTLPPNHRLLLNIVSVCQTASKCCLVVEVPTDQYSPDKQWISQFGDICMRILGGTAALRLFQIVLIIKDDSDHVGGNPDECALKDQNIIEFGNQLSSIFEAVASAPYAQQPLLFKLHIKSVHRTVLTKCRFAHANFNVWIKSIILHYLMAFVHGIMQFKLTYNHAHHSMVKQFRSLKTMQRLFDVDVGIHGYLQHDKIICKDTLDCRQYVISARTKSDDASIQNDKRWSVDCRFCCNTPWV